MLFPLYNPLQASILCYEPQSGAFHLEYSQQGGLQGNSTRQDVQETAWLVNQRESDFP